MKYIMSSNELELLCRIAVQAYSVDCLPPFNIFVVECLGIDKVTVNWILKRFIMMQTGLNWLSKGGLVFESEKYLLH